MSYSGEDEKQMLLQQYSSLKLLFHVFHTLRETIIYDTELKNC